MSEQLDLASNVLGYIGAGLIVLLYFLNQAGLLSSSDLRFPALNLCAALMLLFSLYFHVNLPSVVIELFWAAISIYGIGRCLRARAKSGV
jgi:hypothetical protein